MSSNASQKLLSFLLLVLTLIEEKDYQIAIAEITEEPTDKLEVQKTLLESLAKCLSEQITYFDGDDSTAGISSSEEDGDASTASISSSEEDGSITSDNDDEEGSLRSNGSGNDEGQFPTVAVATNSVKAVCVALAAEKEANEEKTRRQQKLNHYEKKVSKYSALVEAAENEAAQAGENTKAAALNVVSDLLRYCKAQELVK